MRTLRTLWHGSLSMICLLSATRSSEAQLSGCPSYIEITQFPSSPYYETTANITVEYGDQMEPMCLSYGNEHNPNTFRFYVNGVDRTSYFVAGENAATGTNVPLDVDATNDFLATIAGWSENDDPRVDTVEASSQVVLSFIASTTFNNFDNQDRSLCAMHCFSAMHAQSTVPYFSMDEPRSVTLIYNGERIALRPFVYADVSLAPGHPASPQRYWMEVRINGALVTFLNGDTRLHFSVPSVNSTTVRLAGQFDASSYSTNGTGMYPLVITAGIDYAGTVQSRSFTSKLMIIDERKSPIARGWTIAGIQRLYPQTDGSALITDGTGSGVYFSNTVGTGAPVGEFSRLTDSGTIGSKIYYRAYPDSTKMRFNSQGLMTSVIDRFGNQSTIQYDSVGRITRIEDPLRTRIWKCGIPTCFFEKAHIGLVYDQYGLSQLSEVLGDLSLNPPGRITYIRLNSDSTLRAVVDPDGDSTRFAYDQFRRLSSIVNRLDDTSSVFEYDASSWLLDSIRAPMIPVYNGGGASVPVTLSTVTGAWQTVGVPTVSTSSSPAPYTMIDSVAGRITDPEGHTSRFTVDRWGAPLRVTDALGSITTIERTQQALLRSITYPWGANLTLFYEQSGVPLPTWISQTGHAVVRLRYGPYARVDSIWGSGIGTRRMWRGPNGRMDSLQVDTQIVARLYYDTRGRVDSTHAPSAQQAVVYAYDGETGNAASAQFDGGRQVTTLFDLFGRDTSVHAVSQPTRSISYDQMNRVRTLFDGVNTDTIRFEYDPLNLLHVRDAKGQIFRRDVDALGRVTRRYDPADTVDRYLAFAYDRDGRLVWFKNRRGDTLRYDYDALDRLVSKHGSNAIADSFYYAPNFREIVGINAVSRDEIHLSSALWTDSVVTTLNAQRFRIQYRQNSVQQLDSVSILSSNISFANRRLYWNPNSENLDSVRVGSELVKFSQPTAMVPDTISYPSNIKRVTTLSNLGTAYNTEFINNFPFDATFSRGYGLDSLGRIRFYLEELEFPQNRKFSYDGLGRLTREDVRTLLSEGEGTCTSGTPTYGYVCNTEYDSTHTATYDAADNVTRYSFESTNRDFGVGNRVGEIWDWQFENDLDGNVTRKKYAVQPIQTDHRYFWSAESHLTGDSLVGGATTSYAYNAFGQLVRKSRNGVVSRYFLWDGDNLLAELDSNATSREAEYVHLLGIDAPLALVTGSQAIGAIRYFEQDALGNVIGLFDSDIAQTYRYNIWTGTTAFASGDLTDTNRLRWKGLMWDDDSKLYYVRNRWYDPDLARFISEDPIGIAGGLNEYAFAGGDPVNGRDPYGLMGPFGEYPPPPPADQDPRDLPRGARGNIRPGNPGLHHGRCEVATILRGYIDALSNDPTDFSPGDYPGRFDYKFLHPNDVYQAGEKWVHADEFGNFAAGYAGQAVFGDLGWVAMRAGGIYYASRRDKNGNVISSEHWSDLESAPMIDEGARRAEYDAETMHPGSMGMRGGLIRRTGPRFPPVTDRTGCR